MAIVRRCTRRHRDIAAEMSLFTRWLTIIVNNYQRQLFINDRTNEGAAIDTLEVCLQTVLRMKDETKAIESGFAEGECSKRRVSLKAVFRKDRIERVLRETERLKTLLIQVQTCYIGYINSPHST